MSNSRQSPNAKWQVWSEKVHFFTPDNRAGFTYFKREQWNMYHGNPVDEIDKPDMLFDQLCWLRDAGFAPVDVVWLRAGHAIFAGWKPERDD